MGKYQFTYWKSIVLIMLSLLIALPVSAFTVVIDAGHGGNDPGAVGKILQEKHLNLEVAKRLQNLIATNYPDVKVIMTRSTDVFVPLGERADIANKNHADMFISIHTNAADNKKSHGTETFVLGLHKMESNLETAMRENSVITLEEDYQTKYQGFDPNSVESYIMFEFMQDQYLDKSLQFAQLVQNNFTHSVKRVDRGVQQAGFMVLHKSACPSVLIELGFISNAEEEKYMASEAGKKALTHAIFEAFSNYYTKTTGAIPVQLAQVKEEEKPWQKPELTSEEKPWQNKPKAEPQQTQKQKVEYRVQIFSARKVLPANDPTFKGLKNCKYTKDGDWYKYTYGNETDYQKIKQIQKQLTSKFKDCFIVAFLGKEQIPVKKALQL